MTEQVLGRRGTDPKVPSLDKLARDVGRLARAQEKQAKAHEQLVLSHAAHVTDYRRHLELDIERNGRIGKSEARIGQTEAAITTLQAVTYQRLGAIEQGAEIRTQRIQDIADLVVRIEAYQKGRAELLAQVGGACLKAIPLGTKMIGLGLGTGIGVTAVGYLLGLFAGPGG